MQRKQHCWQKQEGFFTCLFFLGCLSSNRGSTTLATVLHSASSAQRQLFTGRAWPRFGLQPYLQSQAPSLERGEEEERRGGGEERRGEEEERRGEERNKKRKRTRRASGGWGITLLCCFVFFPTTPDLLTFPVLAAVFCCYEKQSVEIFWHWSEQDCKRTFHDSLSLMM